MFELGRVSYTRPHLLADTAEIALAFGGYSQVSASDLISIIKSTPRPANELLPLTEDDIDDDDQADTMDGTEKNQKDQYYVDEAFRQIQFRLAAFGSAYPFRYDSDTLTLRNRLTPVRRLYIFLLACARTRSFKSRGTVQKLAAAFEDISAEVMKRIVPVRGVVYMFGSNSADRKRIFSTDLRKAIPLLADKIGMRLKQGWERNFTGSGDGKIDLIGVYNFDSRAPGAHVLLGQCASMEDEKDWQKKRQEARIDSRIGTFDYLVEPQGVLFIPGCYRQPDGDWVNSDFVSGVITIDRLRIILILQDRRAIRDIVNKAYNSSRIDIAA